MKHSAKTLQFEELKSLDLQTCASVGDIVDGLRYCAFGARMLGEVADDDLRRWRRRNTNRC